MLYFQIVGYGESVRVNHPEKEWPYYADNKPVGELLIPEVVTHVGRLYRGGWKSDRMPSMDAAL